MGLDDASSPVSCLGGVGHYITLSCNSAIVAFESAERPKMKREGLMQRTQFYVTLWLILGGAPVLILGGIAGKMANADAQVATAGTKQQGDHDVGIFEPGPLAQPKSPQQAGVSADNTRVTIPSDNPQTPPKIALGQKLFFERRLSADETVACSSCHDPKKAFTDGRPVSIGIKGRVGQRNAPTILNALYNKTQFWDGRVRTLEDQAAQPIVNSSEMGQPSLDKAVARIASIAEYDQAFRDIFGRSPNGPDLLRAIASYERTQISFDSPFDSPFDYFVAGDANAIDVSAKRGWELFNTRGRCNKCHALTEEVRDATNFTDNDFHNIGIGIIRHNVVALARQAKQIINSEDAASVDRAAIQTDMSALGRFLVTKNESDTASFKTPNLRNILVTGPYFHDGSQLTLWDVVDHYNKGAGLQNPYLDGDIQPLALTEGDIDDLVAFLASLTSPDYKDQGVIELARQRELARTNRPQRDTARAFGPKSARPTPPSP
ncbi:cytochrome c peroxidase [Tardiphaga sp.]|uniref:cytochrome-c peroxidase n=1 Tax=Tardiphaga sp. TaxID=1926292 RepID=UPI002608354F|nr:cytochrome c peroxidase [Tardiphaga sp.]MDB5617840.1 cytochrome peroxidase [Tardiphaga sp.]